MLLIVVALGLDEQGVSYIKFTCLQVEKGSEFLPIIQTSAMMNWQNRLLVFWCCWVLPVVAAARTVADVSIPEQVTVGGQTLVLNGAGVREKFFFDIYIAGLYLPHRMNDAQAILDKNPPWRMLMHFVYSRVSRKRLADGWREGFEENLPADRRTALEERIGRLIALFPELHKGDEVVLDHLPRQGVMVTIRGRQVGRIEGDDFARALLAIWLGPRPVTTSLKKALVQGH